MKTNIEIITLNRYFSQTNAWKQPYIYKNYRSKIVPHIYTSINEANISKKISQIPYYSNFFNILEYYESLNVSDLNDDTIKKIINKEQIQYYLFKYSDKNSINFIDYIYNSTSIKKLIFDIINSFSHLLYGLHILNENNICFFNISPGNIIFLEDYREKPVLCDFTMSLQLNKLPLSDLHISHILNKLDNFTYQPFEIHILFYFIKHKMITISYSFIQDFCEEYVENLTILTLFSENYKKIYKENCIETMKKYINHSRQDIIDDIFERSDKWDVFGISIIFIHIFGSISRVFSLKSTFISKITLELSKNLHPDSDKRMSLETTLNVFNKLLNDNNDWNFINKLDNNKLNKLFDDLSK